MKKVILTAVVSTAFIALTSCEKETVLTSSQIPIEISEYVSLHFSDHQILQVVKDVDGIIKTYDVLLDDNISLEFNRKKEIIDIDADIQLPESVIPAKISQYVTSNFPDNFITDWELEGKHQQVGLNNDLDLEFTMGGDFIRIDN